MSELDLNLLLTFRAFVEEGSIAAAGKRLGRSQPAISARLQQLERDLGAPLLEKVGRRLLPTALGRRVDEEAQELAARSRRILDLAQSARAIPTGRLRVGALPTVGVHLLAPLVADLIGDGAVNLDITYALNEQLVQRLVRGDLDAVFTVGDPPHGMNLDVITCGTVCPVLVGPRSRRMPKSVDAAFLRKRTLLGFGRIGDSFFDEIDRYLVREGLTPTVVVSHIHTLKALATNGVGLAILPDYTVADEPQLRTATIRGLALEHPLWLATRESARELAVLRQLRLAVCGTQ